MQQPKRTCSTTLPVEGEARCGGGWSTSRLARAASEAELTAAAWASLEPCRRLCMRRAMRAMPRMTSRPKSRRAPPRKEGQHASAMVLDRTGAPSDGSGNHARN